MSDVSQQQQLEEEASKVKQETLERIEDRKKLNQLIEQNLAVSSTMREVQAYLYQRGSEDIAMANKIGKIINEKIGIL